jgi:hypothetical protein
MVEVDGVGFPLGKANEDVFCEVALRWGRSSFRRLKGGPSSRTGFLPFQRVQISEGKRKRKLTFARFVELADSAIFATGGLMAHKLFQALMI